MAGYFIGMHRYLCTRKAPSATVSSGEFNTMTLNSKIFKVVSYIQDNKAWESIYVILENVFLVFVPFVFQTATKQEWTRYSIIT